MQLFIQKISIAIFNKNIHNQNDAQKSGQLRYIKKLSIALVQTKVINCNFANKVVSCNLCTQKLSQLRRNLAIFSTMLYITLLTKSEQLKNNCRHGLSGRTPVDGKLDCDYNHPQLCRKFLHNRINRY